MEKKFSLKGFFFVLALSGCNFLERDTPLRDLSFLYKSSLFKKDVFIGYILLQKGAFLEF